MFKCSNAYKQSSIKTKTDDLLSYSCNLKVYASSGTISRQNLLLSDDYAMKHMKLLLTGIRKPVILFSLYICIYPTPLTLAGCDTRSIFKQRF